MVRSSDFGGFLSEFVVHSNLRQKRDTPCCFTLFPAAILRMILQVDTSLLLVFGPSIDAMELNDR